MMMGLPTGWRWHVGRAKTGSTMCRTSTAASVPYVSIAL